MQVARKAAYARRYPRPLRLVKAGGRKKPHYSFSFGTFLSIVLLLAVVIMFNLSQRALIAQETLQVEKLKTALEREEVIYEKLLLQTKNLRSPQRVETVATQKLAMIKPTQIRYIYLPGNLSISGNETVRKTSDKSKSSYSQSASTEPNLLTIVLNKISQQTKALTSGGLSQQAKSN